MCQQSIFDLCHVLRWPGLEWNSAHFLVSLTWSWGILKWSEAQIEGQGIARQWWWLWGPKWPASQLRPSLSQWCENNQISSIAESFCQDPDLKKQLWSLAHFLIHLPLSQVGFNMLDLGWCVHLCCVWYGLALEPVCSFFVTIWLLSNYLVISLLIRAVFHVKGSSISYCPNRRETCILVWAWYLALPCSGLFLKLKAP